LQGLGYIGLAFTHTAYTGRLHATKDDADVALPWDDLLFPPSVSSDKEEDNAVTARIPSFGRRDKRTGMQIYRRLNIIIEESSDISRLLLHSSPTSGADTTATTTNIKSVQQILQTYDIVSIQPMNEQVLQSICDLLSNIRHSTQHNQYQHPHEEKVMMNKNFSNNNNTNNNIHYIDIIVLEYATGSKGGYGLPYKLRKEYIHQILLQQQYNNIIFEINYATAMVDNKRRQGLIRTLLDIHIGYDSIQKKHNNDSSRLSNFCNDNKTKNNKRGRRSKKKKSTGIDTTTITTTRIKLFPYIISSGSRQDYTTGSDEGLLTFRTPHDVNYYIQYLIGNSNFSCCAKGDGLIGTNASVERMLTHAYNRVMGVVTVITSSSTYNKRLRGETTRSYVVVDRCDTVTTTTTTTAAADDDIDDDDEEEEEGNNGTVASSLIDWLSSSTPPPCNRKRKNRTDGTTTSTNPLSHRSTSNSDDAIILPTAALEENVEFSNGHVKNDDDIEDGYIAM
jgi:hypothetical protein